MRWMTWRATFAGPSLKAFTEKTLNKPMCDAATKKGCAANELKFIEKHEAKTAAEITAVLDEKAEELKAGAARLTHCYIFVRLIFRV